MVGQAFPLKWLRFLSAVIQPARCTGRRERQLGIENAVLVCDFERPGLGGCAMIWKELPIMTRRVLEPERTMPGTCDMEKTAPRTTG